MKKNRLLTPLLTSLLTAVNRLVNNPGPKFLRDLPYLEPSLSSHFPRPLPPNIWRKGSGKLAVSWFNWDYAINIWARVKNQDEIRGGGVENKNRDRQEGGVSDDTSN